MGAFSAGGTGCWDKESGGTRGEEGGVLIFVPQPYSTLILSYTHTLPHTLSLATQRESWG